MNAPGRVALVSLFALWALVTGSGCTSTEEEPGTEAVRMFHDGQDLYQEAGGGTAEEQPGDPRMDRAIEMFEQALQLEPSYTQARFYAAVIYFNKAGIPMTEGLRLVAQANTERDAGRATQAEVLERQAEEKKREANVLYDAARRHLEVLYNAGTPEIVRVATMLGFISVMFNDYERAEQYFRDAIDHTPDPEQRRRLERAINECEEGLTRQRAQQ